MHDVTDDPEPADVPLASTTGDGEPATLAGTPRSRSWLWPTAGLIAILLVVVAVGKLGQTPTDPAATPLAPAPVSQRPAVPDRSLTVVERPVSSSAVGLIGRPIGIRSDGTRYVDGIPAVLDGNPVVRVRDAAALPAGSVVLVGGWSRRSSCATAAGAAPCPAELSDVPVANPNVAALTLSGEAAFDFTEGPRIFLASVQGDPVQLDVGESLWTGDDQTAAAPLAVPAGSQPPAWPTLLASGLPRAAAMNRAASSTPPRSTPCSMPRPSSR